MIDVPPGLQLAAMIADELCQRLHEACAPAARDGHPSELDRDRDHLRHEPRRCSIGTEAGVKHPRGEQPVCAL